MKMVYPTNEGKCFQVLLHGCGDGVLCRYQFKIKYFPLQHYTLVTHIQTYNFKSTVVVEYTVPNSSNQVLQV